MSKIIIDRENNYYNGAVSFNVMLDGKKMGKVANGQRIEFPATVGKHRLFLKSLFDMSNTINIDIFDSATEVIIKCKMGALNPKLEVISNISSKTLSQKYEELETLTKFKEKGIITEEEFNAEKEKILQKSKDNKKCDVEQKIDVSSEDITDNIVILNNENNLNKDRKKLNLKNILGAIIKYSIGIFLIFIGLIFIFTIDDFIDFITAVIFISWGVSFMPFIYKLLENKSNTNLSKAKIFLPIIIPIIGFFIIFGETSDSKADNSNSSANLNTTIDNEKSITYTSKDNDTTNNNKTNSFDSTFKSNLKKALKEINFNYDNITNLTRIDDWNNGPRYTFSYNSHIYYVYAYEDGQISSINEYSPVGEKIYTNNNIKTEKTEEDSILLVADTLGEYGKKDYYSGYEVIRYYIPAGTYKVTALNKNSSFFIEEQSIYVNSDGYEESAIVEKISLPNYLEETTITIKENQCINLTINAKIKLKKL